MADTFQPILSESQNQTSPLGRPMVDTRKGDTYRSLAQGVDAVGSLIEDRAKKKKEEESDKGTAEGIDILFPETDVPTPDPEVPDSIKEDVKKISQLYEAKKQGVRGASANLDITLRTTAKRLLNESPTEAKAFLDTVLKYRDISPTYQEYDINKKRKESLDTEALSSATILHMGVDGTPDIESTIKSGYTNLTYKREAELATQRNNLAKSDQDRQDSDQLQVYTRRLASDTNGLITQLIPAIDALEKGGEVKDFQALAPQIQGITTKLWLEHQQSLAQNGTSSEGIKKAKEMFDSNVAMVTELFNGDLGYAKTLATQFTAAKNKAGLAVAEALPVSFAVSQIDPALASSVFNATDKLTGLTASKAIMDEVKNFSNNLQTTQAYTTQKEVKNNIGVNDWSNTVDVIMGKRKLDGLTIQEQQKTVSIMTDMLKSRNEKGFENAKEVEKNAWGKLSTQFIDLSIKGTNEDLKNSLLYLNSSWINNYKEYAKSQSPEEVDKLSKSVIGFSDRLIGKLQKLNTSVPQEVYDNTKVVFNPVTKRMELDLSKNLPEYIITAANDLGINSRRKIDTNKYVVSMQKNVLAMNQALDLKLNIEKYSPLKVSTELAVDNIAQATAEAFGIPVKGGKTDANDTTTTGEQTNANTTPTNSSRRFIYDESKDELRPSE